MRRFALCLPLMLAAACSAPGVYPSLAARGTEAIDPRLPIDPAPSPGPLDPSLAERLRVTVSAASGGVAQFNRLAAMAERAAGAAGPRQSESWIVAQQALSALVAQHGVTSRAAGDIDALAGERIEAARWIAPANRAAIEDAAATVAAIDDAQSAIIARLGDRLGG
jgi:hypothetical protein